MHSSDETGDERKGLASTGGAAEAETAKLPAHAFRERIRRASVAAAQSAAPPPQTPARGAQGSQGSPSLLPPEQSGVHDRSSDAPPEAAPDAANPSSLPPSTDQTQAAAPPASSGTVQDAAAVGVQKQSSAGWPFGGGRDDRRLHHHTHLGMGMPQRSAAAGNPRGPAPVPGNELSSAESDAEDSEARRRLDTRDTKRSATSVSARPTSSPPARASKSIPPPPPQPQGPQGKNTPPRPFRARDAKWSPTSTKPQRASLLRADALKEPQAGRGEQRVRAEQEQLAPYTLSSLADEYLEVSVDAHGLSISSADVAETQLAQDVHDVQDAEIVDPQREANGTDTAAAGGSADAGAGHSGARARRYTPKQRGRGRDRSGAPDDRAEYAPTIPDLRPTFTPINQTVRGPGAQINASQPQSRPPALPLPSPISGNPLRLNPLSGLDPASKLTHPGFLSGAAPVTPDTPTQPRGRPVPGMPMANPLVASPLFTTKPAFAHPAAFNNARQPQVPTARPTPRSPFAPAATQRGAAANHVPPQEASIVVDPSLRAQVTEVRAPLRTDKRPVQQPYQPLPSDPAAFEQMMRDQAAARGVRLNWKQQATLVIPREELEAPTEQRLITPKMVAGFVAATLVGALVMLVIGRYGDSSGRRTATDTSTSAAATSNSVVIATEPSGAELLLDGAVVGNTPLEVPRPPRGRAELTYVIRMRGFTQELIRLGAESQAAIRVTLTPDTGVQ